MTAFPDWTKFDKFFVGSDQYFRKLNDLATSTTDTLTKYPPYNIKKIEDNKYVIEMAVAGFAKHDIELTLEDNKLIINGKTKTDEDANYLWKGISNRTFSREFTLADNVEVKNADLLNGMLKVWLEAVIPEHKKPKTIPINDPKPETTSKSKFLTEKSNKND